MGPILTIQATLSRIGGSFAVGQTINQQLMSTANLGTVHDQADLAQMTKRGRQPLPDDRLVPASHPAGLFKERPKRLTVLNSFASPGTFPAILLRVTDRLW